MPRNYIKKLGSRTYRNYSDDYLDECLNKIRNGQLTQRVAAAQYNIPRSTLKNKLKGAHVQKHGKPPVFTEEEESSFVQHLLKLSEYGFPVDEFDFRMVVKNYLSKKGCTVAQFKNNIPGYEWCKLFLKRHPVLTTRCSANIKKVRAAVTYEVLEEYLDNLSSIVENIPPENLWNYDETNLSDDPGVKKVICKRGAKYIETICNHSKSAISIMFTGNAAGEFLPPYVVYKAENMWTTWTEGGPPGVRYNRSKSGWFDCMAFEDWFLSAVLPTLKNQAGTKVLIGDNLSSHISPLVLQKCQENDIKFVCLPANSTHLTQPLDVAFFGPMKRIWRNILREWKETRVGGSFTTLPKDLFPSLLKKLLEGLQENQAANIISGFRKCSIYPFDRTQLINSLPLSSDLDVSSIGEAFLEHLTKKREAVLGLDVMKKRRKKINIPPGKSIALEDVVHPSVSEASPSGSIPVPTKKTRRKCKVMSSSESETSADESALSIQSDDVSHHSDTQNGSQEEPVEEQVSNILISDLNVGGFVIVLYNEKEFPGVITEILEDGAYVSCMEFGRKCWKWPTHKDVLFYDSKDIVRKIDPPTLVSKRGFFSIPGL